MSSPRKRIVVLISGRGSNLAALLDAAGAPDYPARVCAVISNRADAAGLDYARRAGVSARVIAHGDYSSREQFDDALRHAIEEFAPDLVVLAGFMRVLTSGFVQHFLGRLLNIHPSLLPNYKGLNTHQRAIDDRAKIHGATVHFVSPDVDGGAAIIQAAVPVEANDTATTLAERVLEQEHVILPLAVRWFAEGRLYLRGNAVFMDGNVLEQPIRL